MTLLTFMAGLLMLLHYLPDYVRAFLGTARASDLDSILSRYHTRLFLLLVDLPRLHLCVSLARVTFMFEFATITKTRRYARTLWIYGRLEYVLYSV